MLNKAIINLNNLVFNAKEIKKRLDDGVKFCAVVKADAYGHGISEVSSALYPYVDYYAVAIAEEGVCLRQSGIDKPILVLTPVYPNDLSIAVDYNLTLTITDVCQIKALNLIAKRKKKRVSVHVKYNTGMNRQGVDCLNELGDILNQIKCSKWVSFEGLYTHFGAPENKRYINCALNKFLLAINLCKGYNNKVIVHASASGGFLQGVQFDMVRIGIMLYGYTPFPTDKIRLKKVMRVEAPVIAKRQIACGDNCLYGNKKAKRKSSVNIVRFGYADGLVRKKDKDQINNRCMDVSAYYKNKNSKTVVVMADAGKIAKSTGTICYEVLCAASRRAEKVYRR